MTTSEQQLNELNGYADRQRADIAEQGTPAWLAERVGHITASRFKDVMDTLKSGKPGAKKLGYRKELVVERITGRAIEHFVSKDMECGTALEPMARIAYEAHTGAMVDQCGFLHHTSIQWVGGSPDGLVDDDGMIEIKCPRSTTHIETMLTDECEYTAQIQGLLWITGRKWCDYVSFDPEMPEGLQLYVRRIVRDDEYIAALSDEIKNELAEVSYMVSQLNERVK